MDQQGQTLEYFRLHAEDWQRKSVNIENEFSVIDGRHQAVLAVIQNMKGAARRFLDVGCGTGQLALESARLGLKASGIDFSPEMIAQCEANRQRAGVDATFNCLSFFDFPVSDAVYDVVSAQGFIEYISLEQMEEFFQRASRMLRVGGSLAIGSRNRLYNAVSMNAFTQMEAKLGVLPALVAEAIDLQTSTSQADAFAALRKHEMIHPQPPAHPDTGIGVSLRYQFSPGELVCRLRKHGFEPEAVYPVHFHPLAPNLKSDHSMIHHEIAKLMQRIAGVDQRLVPFCSTFVLDVRRVR